MPKPKRLWRFELGDEFPSEEVLGARCAGPPGVHQVGARDPLGIPRVPRDL